MQRYFILNNQMSTTQATITGSDVHHISNVMRFNVGDSIIVCNEEGQCYLSSISTIEPKHVEVELSTQLDNTDLPLRVDIAQALIRRERFEYMIQKSTELGVTTIIPTVMTNTIVKLDDKKQSRKLERWNTMAKEASEQSHRTTKAVVIETMNLFEIPFDFYDLVLVAYEKETENMSLQQLLQPNIKNILVIIGPEGGFTPSEIKRLNTIDNTYCIGLGKRILRSETASSYILSVIGYTYEMVIQ